MAKRLVAKLGACSLLASAGVWVSGCSAGNGEADQVMDRDLPKSIQQPIYGGNTVVDTTTSTGAIGATAQLTIAGGTCSGTLVTPTKVVTAAHCFQCPGVFTAAGITVSFPQGATPFSSTLSAPPAILSLSHGCNNPYAYDLAVVTLTTPVPASVATPQQILLADPGYAINDGSLLQPCSVVGYGGNVIYNSGTGSGTRRVGSIAPSWYSDACGDVCEGLCNDDYFWRQDLSTTHAVTAQGDSGGGLFCTMNGAPVLVGVDSGWQKFDLFCNHEENMVHAGTGGNQIVHDFLAQQIGYPNVAAASSFAVYAKGQVNINDRASVVDATGNHGAPIASGTGGRLGTDSHVGNVFADGASQVADRARVEGTMIADGGIAIGNSVQGTFIKYRYSQLPGFDLQVTYPTASAGDVILHQNVKQTIGAPFAAGKLIGSVILDQGSNLTLSCGTTYFINSLTINAGGRLSVDTSCGPGRIYVKSSIVINYGDVFDLNTNVLGDIILGYSGTKEVTPSSFFGTLVAPRAKVSVSNGVSFLGAIFAASVEVHQDSAVIHYPFNFPWI